MDGFLVASHQQDGTASWTPVSWPSFLQFVCNETNVGHLSPKHPMRLFAKIVRGQLPLLCRSLFIFLTFSVSRQLAPIPLVACIAPAHTRSPSTPNAWYAYGSTNFTAKLFILYAPTSLAEINFCAACYPTFAEVQSDSWSSTISASSPTFWSTTNTTTLFPNDALHTSIWPECPICSQEKTSRVEPTRRCVHLEHSRQAIVHFR